MKKEYMKPGMESEVFVANEYVAACLRFESTGGVTANGYWEESPEDPKEIHEKLSEYFETEYGLSPSKMSPPCGACSTNSNVHNFEFSSSRAANVATYSAIS